MKKKLFFQMAALSGALFLGANVNAQDTLSTGKHLEKAGQKATHAVEKTANKVGNKTAQIASNGKSAVVDKVYKGKKGPNGEKVYIDGQKKTYYVDDKGHKQYIPEAKLQDAN